MLIPITKPLFAWDCLEDNPSLKTIRRFLDTIPDAKLLEGLRQARGRGRDDYPVHVLWGVVLLTIALRHISYEACLADLRRNADLRKLIGIDSAEGEEKVPKAWNMSRFLDVLGQDPHRSELQAIFNGMIKKLGLAIPDFGMHTAADSSALNARLPKSAKLLIKEETVSTPVDTANSTVTPRPGNSETANQLAESKKAGDTKESKENESKDTYDEHGLPYATGGRKEYTDDQGRVTKVVTWLGYKMHLLVDVKHEVALAYRISSPKMGDTELLPDLVSQALDNLPAGRIKTLAYDKAADNDEAHQLLHDAEIKALIENRSLWRNQTEKMLPGHDGRSNVVYDEAGTLFCYDTQSSPPVRHQMSYIGHEPERGTLKYRCPAMHEGFECPMSSICNEGLKYGKTVRVDQEIDLRRFPSIPRATKKFERLYNGRTAVERVNARMKIFWGSDDGNIVGPTRFFGLLGAVMIVHAAFATVLASLPRREGTLGKLRLGPIAEALEASSP